MTSAISTQEMLADPVMQDVRDLGDKIIQKVALSRALEEIEFDAKDEVAEGALRLLALLYRERKGS